MKSFDTLYKRTKSGDIQYWKIKTVSCPDHTLIHKESGQYGTLKPVTHTETVKSGKNIGKANATTHEQQADLQAESDWKKKRDEGYKSTKDLKITISGDLMHFSYDYTNYKSLGEVLKIALPQFNTDASGNIKPMLAKAVNWDKVKYPCFVQPKLDGVRCLMVVNEPEVKFLSRSGKEYTTLDHIGKDIFEAYANGTLMGNFILDGEIYSHELTFQEIVKAVKKQSDNSLKLKFRAYDVVNDAGQGFRWEMTKDITIDIASEYVHFVETVVANSKEDVTKLHDSWVKDGYEGAMIRHFDGIYGQGQRSWDLLKVKEFDETEYTVVDFELGQREEDLIAVCQDVSGVFRAKMKGPADYKKEIWTWWNTPMAERTKNKFNKPQLTVQHFGRTDDGLPRFPVGKAIRDYE